MKEWIKEVKEIYQYALASVIVIGFFWLLIVLARKEIPDNNSDLLNITVGAMIASFSSVISYFFGSSKGSSDKTKLMNKE